MRRQIASSASGSSSVNGFSGKRFLVRAWHFGPSLISATFFFSTPLFSRSCEVRHSRVVDSMSEGSAQQLSQASSEEISSTVIFLLYSPVIEFSAAAVSRFILRHFLAPALSVCDSRMAELLLVEFSKFLPRIPNKWLVKVASASLLALRSFRSDRCQP